MISPLALCCIAGALAATRPRPRGRLSLGAPDPTHRPRDGPAGADPNRCASDIALFAACSTAGLSPAQAAAAVADTYAGLSAGSGTAWHTTAALLALGADPERAWSELRAVDGGADLANLVTMSNSSGSALAAGCYRIAERLRSEGADHATAKAERAGVLIAIPLTAFFLPAFFALGLAPVVISLGSTVLR